MAVMNNPVNNQTKRSGEDDMEVLCKSCGSELKVKYYKKYGRLLLISCLPMFPLLMMISYGTIVPFAYVLFSIIFSCYLFFKREKYFYFCDSCKLKIPRADVEKNEL